MRALGFGRCSALAATRPIAHFGHSLRRHRQACRRRARAKTSINDLLGRNEHVCRTGSGQKDLIARPSVAADEDYRAALAAGWASASRAKPSRTRRRHQSVGPARQRAATVLPGHTDDVVPRVPHEKEVGIAAGVRTRRTRRLAQHGQMGSRHEKLDLRFVVTAGEFVAATPTWQFHRC